MKHYEFLKLTPGADVVAVQSRLMKAYDKLDAELDWLNRPVIYFQPDRAVYDRELYFDPDASPLIVAHTEEELLDLLSSPIDAAANCRAVLEFFGACESGHAAESVARWIAARLDGGTADGSSGSQGPRDLRGGT